MEKKSGRPRKTLAQTKTQLLQVRLSLSEKQAFSDAADLVGLELSAWVRERLRLAAIRELEGAGCEVPFVKRIPLRATNG